MVRQTSTARKPKNCGGIRAYLTRTIPPLPSKAQRRAPGGSIKAEGLGDGFEHAKKAIAKLRLTLPPAY